MGRPSFAAADRRGRGKQTQRALRISKSVLEFFRASGPGWQTRVDKALKRYVASQRR